MSYELNDKVADAQTWATEQRYKVGTGWIAAVENAVEGSNVVMVIPTMRDRDMLVAAMLDPLADRKVKIDKKLTTFHEVVLSNGARIRIESAQRGERALIGIDRSTVMVFVYR